MGADDIRTITLPTLYPKQRDVFYSPARIVTCEASTKAGKSVGCLHWLMFHGFNATAPESALWISPVYSQAEQMFVRLCRILTKAEPTKTLWQDNKTKLSVRLGQCVLYFKGSDNPDSIYGPDYARAVIDEASRVKEEAWFAVRSTLTATQGSVRIIGNVKGRKNWAYKLARKAEAGERDMAYFRLTASDAVAGGVIKPEDVEDARRDLPEQVFRELYFAEPTEDGSNPFGLNHIAACLLPAGQPLPLGSAEPVCYGVDLAKSVDWTVVYGLGSEGSVVRMERWQGAAWDQSITRLSGIVGNTPTLIDETGVGSPVCDELRRAGCIVEGYTFTQASKQALMGRLAVAIQRHEIRFPDGVTRSELESFEFEHTSGGVRYSAPSGMHDDCVCALALATWKWDQSRHNMSVIEWADRKPATVSMDFDKLREDGDWGWNE